MLEQQIESGKQNELKLEIYFGKQRKFDLKYCKYIKRYYVPLKNIKAFKNYYQVYFLINGQFFIDPKYKITSSKDGTFLNLLFKKDFFISKQKEKNQFVQIKTKTSSSSVESDSDSFVLNFPKSKNGAKSEESSIVKINPTEKSQKNDEDSKNKHFKYVLVYQLDRFARDRYASAKELSKFENGTHVVNSEFDQVIQLSKHILAGKSL